MNNAFPCISHIGHTVVTDFVTIIPSFHEHSERSQGAWVATWPVWHIKSPTSPSNWWMVTFHGLERNGSDTYACDGWGQEAHIFLGGKNKCKKIVRTVPKIGADTHTHTHTHTDIHTLHYITLHYITLHYITLHYITVQYSTVQYITLHYITLHYITLHYITLHYITLHYITLHYITLHYIHTYIHTYTHSYIIHTHTVSLHYVPLNHITFRFIPLHTSTLSNYIHTPIETYRTPRATNIILSSASQVTLWVLNCTSARWLSLTVSDSKAICQKPWQMFATANTIKYLIQSWSIFCVFSLHLFMVRYSPREDDLWLVWRIGRSNQTSLMEPQNWPVQPKPTKAVPAATALDPLSSEK